MAKALLQSRLRFQSTPSARRATHSFQILTYARIDFNPRPPRGGRPGQRRRVGSHRLISIHALREEGDPSLVNSNLDLFLFQSTPSARRATPTAGRPANSRKISIHALREEGDRRLWRFH